MYLIPVLLKDGYAGGCYDHQGKFGLVIIGAPTIESLRQKANELGYALRDA